MFLLAWGKVGKIREIVHVCMYFRGLEAMAISKWQVGFFLVIVLSVPRGKGRVLSVGHPPEKLATIEETQVWRRTSSFRGEDFFDTSKREVPSCPDPLHNR